MSNSKTTMPAIWAVKLLLIACITGITVAILNTVPDWTGYTTQRTGLYIAMLTIALFVSLHRFLWQRVLRVPANLMRLLGILTLTTIALILLPSDFMDATFVDVCVIIFALLMLGIGTILNEHQRTNLANLGVSFVSLIMMVAVMEIFAPQVTDIIAEAQRQAAVEQWQAASQQAHHPEDAAEVQTDTSGVQLYSPQVEVLETEPGPAWGEATGWGTSVNTRMRYWLDGVYDNIIEYNALGFRGEAIPYEKSDDVYRILLIGDSFIEAREVAYEDTIYAQLGALLADTTTPDGKRIEVFGVGATGWGTLQSYLYYHHEGHKFAPDLVINLFVINDVVDNFPSAFYPSRDIEFAIFENSVVVVHEDELDEEAAQLSALKRLLDVSPAPIAESNIAQLLLQVFDPPRQSVTIAGDLTKLHPQNYIYVRYPEVDNYPEAWERTRQAYTIWSREIEERDAELMVLAVDPSVDRISEISTYFQEARGWVWDVDLPTTRLHDILDPLDVHLIETRDTYSNYAESVGASPFSTLYYVQDGHWNPIGHRVTAELLATTLHDLNITD